MSHSITEVRNPKSSVGENQKMRKSSIMLSMTHLVFLSVFLWAGTALGEELDKAPSFSLKSLENIQDSEVESSSLEGKIVLLNFFTTTCAICRAEFPTLIAINDEYIDREDVQVVGIAIDPMVKPVESLVDIIGIDYPVLMGKLETLVNWKVRGFPTSFLINKQWEIYRQYSGLREKSVFVSDIEEIIENE